MHLPPRSRERDLTRRGSGRRRSCWRWASCWCRGRRALDQRHEVDEDILLRVAADDSPPVSPAADGRRPEGAVVVVVALVSRLHRRIGLGR